ncbi:MAG TPA: zf-HC2 domain-containing protein [Bryobacteraceae bacterium]|nr:zf-HC2 domain-containing protein [Bryobacteraceae bacterium]
MDHLTELDLRAYRSRTLPANDLLRISAHIAVCEECRAKLRQQSSSSEAIQNLRAQMEEHVTAGDLQNFVDGALEQSRRVRIEEHLSWCAECRADVASLMEFARSSKKPAPAPRRFASWWIAAAAALAITTGLALWFQRPTVLVMLNDVSGRVTLDSRGVLHGVAGVTQDQAASIRRVLAGGTLQTPRVLGELAPPQGALMGSTNAAPFHLESPLGTVVDVPMPSFRWTEWKPRANYVVTIKNLASGEVMSSSPLNVPEWKPSQALQAGVVYEWQVAAKWNGHEELAPTPPAPPARFRVIAAPQLQELERMPPSHLARAIVYAEAGLLDKAIQEANALAGDNPGSPIAAAVRRQIEDLRRARF